MKKLLFILMLIPVFAQAQFVTIGYYTQWSVCDLPPQYIDWSALTHLIYFWGEPTNNVPYFNLTAGSSDSLTFENGTPGWCTNPSGRTHQQIIRDSANAHGIKLILCVGGEWGDRASIFANMIADYTKQDAFITACTGFAKRHGYQGIDIDWEFPDRGIPARTMYNRFLQRLRIELDTWNPRGILTCALPVWLWWDTRETDPSVDVASLNQYFDFIDIMGYGLHSSQVSHYAPIYHNSSINQEVWDDRCLNEYKKAGVDSNKLVMLISFENGSMTGSILGGSDGNAQMWQTRSAIPSIVLNNPLWDDQSKCSYGFSWNTFWTFETPKSLQEKINYVKRKHGRGAGVWDIWREYTGIKETPLLSSLKSAVTDVKESIIPNAFALLQNYPNPFNPTTTIEYHLKNETPVLLEIYNSLGERICRLVNENQYAGAKQLTWDARMFPSGMYFCHLSTKDFQATKSMLLIK